MEHDAMTRLRAVNPSITDPDRGKQPVAQAALHRILDAPSPRAAARPWRARTPRGLVLVFAVLLVGVGGALAATDPMGWWSNNASEAHYRVNPSVRVRTPTAQQIRCHPGANGHFTCTPETTRCYQRGQQPPFCKLAGAGLPYTKIDTIHAPPRDSILTRAGFEKAISRAVAAGTMTAADAARFRSDLARVPDSFFTEFRLASRYGTYSSGGETRRGKMLVPPVGQPDMLVCTAAPSRVSCQNINGDANTPVGAGVYAAEQGPGWRWIKAPSYTGGLPPGVRFTRAEYRILIDLARLGTTKESSGTRKVTTVPIVHIHGAPTRTSAQK